MASNPFTIVSNDPRAARLTGVARKEMQEAQGGADTDDKILDDEAGPVMAFGRGVNDPNVTYLALYNTNNTKVYIYPNAAGDGVQVSTVKP